MKKLLLILGLILLSIIGTETFAQIHNYKAINNVHITWYEFSNKTKSGIAKHSKSYEIEGELKITVDFDNKKITMSGIVTGIYEIVTMRTEMNTEASLIIFDLSEDVGTGLELGGIFQAGLYIPIDLSDPIITFVYEYNSATYGLQRI